MSAAPIAPSHSPWPSAATIRLWWPIALGMAVLYVPTLRDLLTGIWASDQQGHGPLVLGLACWLIWRQRAIVAALPVNPLPAAAWPLLVVASLSYALGRSQGILILEVGSSILMLAGSILLLMGHRQLRALWFPFFFLCFMVPLPGPLVDALTQPMKMAVSYVADRKSTV